MDFGYDIRMREGRERGGGTQCSSAPAEKYNLETCSFLACMKGMHTVQMQTYRNIYEQEIKKYCTK